MDSRTLVSVASAAVALVAVVASLITTLLSLRTQRENTRTTLEAQERVATIQDRSLRERLQLQDLQARRAEPYMALISWSERLLAALSEMDQESATLPGTVWNIDPAVDSLLDLYASDTIHVRYAALRGDLLGLVEGGRLPAKVTWQEDGLAVTDVRVEHGPAPLHEWPERDVVRSESMDRAIDLIAQVRAEIQGRESRGYYVIWRLS